MSEKYYIVTRSFVDDTGSLMTVGKRLNHSSIKTSMLQPLTEYGFIEVEEQHNLIIWAENLGFEWDNNMKLFKANLTSDGGGEITHTVSPETMQVFYKEFGGSRP